MRCPICKHEIEAEGNRFRPFCSERCQLIDLDNWLSNRYRIASSLASPAPEASDLNDGERAEADFE